MDILDLDLVTVQGLQLMRALVTGGPGQVDEFLGRLKYLEQPFECCVKDLRSHVEILVFSAHISLSGFTQVIRECCITAAYLAQELQYKVARNIQETKCIYSDLAD